VYGPVIQGSIFRLRPPRQEDAEVIHTWFEDLEVTQGLGTRFPPSLDEERDWLRKAATDPNRVVWVIEHEGRAVGTTSINGIDWSRQAGDTGTCIGDKTVWGRGIAGELMRLRADFAFRELALRKLRSGYLEGNEASRKAQEGAGYRVAGRLRQEFYRAGDWVDLVLTELLREDWDRDRTVPTDSHA
jgi:RimJ/RimL family protein N-acetyltransferase